MASSGIPPQGFNYLTKAFIPKKNFVALRHGVVLRPKASRPLGLKNADAKAVSSSIAHIISPLFS
eukprot:11779805-Karenia_brevis.AAC.1